MSKFITIGKRVDGKGNLTLDLDILLRTRMLLQANSGGGKSFLIRRLAEQLFGKVQVIIIDPEGEFPSLREKYGYVLVGKGGETPADVRSAGLVAEKLLELNASAVCDISETFSKTPQNRHTWVKNFCNAMLEAPKRLWHPCILIVDEFHKYVPEGKAGESEASESVIGIGTDGRKRGICLIGATQRLSKVRKDVSAELLNRMVGSTFEDVDVDRAIDLLSVSKDDRRLFANEMRTLEPGTFYALGRAICKERTLVKVGSVETTHPEIGKANYKVSAPPQPEKVRALLPKLADLPRQAEAREMTVDALNKEVFALRRQLREIPKPKVEEKVREVRVLDKIAAERLVKKVLKEKRDLFSGLHTELTRTVSNAIADLWNTYRKALDSIPEDLLKELPSWMPTTIDQQSGVKSSREYRGDFSPRIPPDQRVTEMKHPSPKPDDGAINTRILDTIGMLNDRGIAVTRQAVARWMGIHPNGGRFLTNLATLRSNGYIEGLTLTVIGHEYAKPQETGLRAALEAIKEGTRQKVLETIAGGPPCSRQELAERLGIHPNGGRFLTDIARLREMGLVTEKGQIQTTQGCNT
jgi:chromosome segregation and condensation protein ScpB